MDDTHLILEVKGVATQQDEVKWEYLREWIQAVNEYGGFGKWDWGVASEPNDIVSLLENNCVKTVRKTFILSMES